MVHFTDNWIDSEFLMLLGLTIWLLYHQTFFYRSIYIWKVISYFQDLIYKLDEDNSSMKTKNTGIAMEMFTESACTFCTYIYSNLALD